MERSIQRWNERSIERLKDGVTERSLSIERSIVPSFDRKSLALGHTGFVPQGHGSESSRSAVLGRETIWQDGFVRLELKKPVSGGRGPATCGISEAVADLERPWNLHVIFLFGARAPRGASRRASRGSTLPSHCNRDDAGYYTAPGNRSVCRPSLFRRLMELKPYLPSSSSSASLPLPLSTSP